MVEQGLLAGEFLVALVDRDRLFLDLPAESRDASLIFRRGEGSCIQSLPGRIETLPGRRQWTSKIIPRLHDISLLRFRGLKALLGCGVVRFQSCDFRLSPTQLAYECSKLGLLPRDFASLLLVMIIRNPSHPSVADEDERVACRRIPAVWIPRSIPVR